jgi:hypothetical protein
MRASVYIAEAQAAYLRQLEFGGVSKGLHMPVASTARDASGDIRKAFRRSSAAKARLFSQTISIPSAKGARRAGKYFECLPTGGRYRSAGLFMRTKDGGIRRVSRHVSARRSPAQLSCTCLLIGTHHGLIKL